VSLAQGLIYLLSPPVWGRGLAEVVSCPSVGCPGKRSERPEAPKGLAFGDKAFSYRSMSDWLLPKEADRQGLLSKTAQYKPVAGATEQRE
jgi:hypothetical protein